MVTATAWVTVSRIARSLLATTVLFGALLVNAVPAFAQTACSGPDCVYFTQTDSVSNALMNAINAETVRIDISTWYLDDFNVYNALVNRFKAGVPVRLIGDRGSIFIADPNTKNTFEFLASQGVPIRLRYNPTWYPEIDHWKAAIFVGQGKVELGSPNFTTFELAPFSSTNYNDENALFTSDPALFNAMESKFDTYWNDTTDEPESQQGPGPYFKNWDDACALEPNCADYYTNYPNPVPMVINTARLFPNYPPPPDLIFGQGPDFNTRLDTEINNESSFVDIVVYRLTVPDITQALLNKAAQIPVHVLIEPNQYINRVYPEFQITHANIDTLWAAGVPIKIRTHTGNTHMKTLITSNYATIASSNFAAAWERDHDYFVSASDKPAIYSAIKANFEWMWNNTDSYTTFTPGGPDSPALAAPGNGQTGVGTTPTLTWNKAVFATNYDVLLGTSSSSLAKIGNVQVPLVNTPPDTFSLTVSSALACNTTYFWQVVSRTNATPRDPNLIASSDIESFTTGSTGCGGGGGGGGPLPSPWQTQDVGSTGVTGSASYSNGTFTVQGAGADIWGTTDAFRYVYQPVSGDIQIVARAASLTNTSSFAKAGVMLRASNAATSAMVILDTTPGGVEFMTRPSNGGSVQFIAGASQTPPVWLRLARSGNTVTGSVSNDGANWSTVGTTTVSFSSANIGVLAMSHNTSQLTTATFDNVSVGPPSGGGGGGGGGPLPSPWQSQDVGATGLSGSASYASGTFTVKGAGADIWASTDAFQYVYQPVTGDIQIVARAVSLTNTSSFAKAGVMLRASNSASSAMVILDTTPGGVEFMTRSSNGGNVQFIAGTGQTAPVWLRLARTGNTVTASVSSDGTSWSTVGTTTVSFSSAANIGLLAMSHNTSQLTTATFDNVTVGAVSGGGGGGGGTTATNVVIYGSDVPAASLHGSWTLTGDAGAANGTKLATTDTGAAQTSAPLASPSQYFDVSFTAQAGTPYTIWLRLSALNNSKFNDSIWVQFSDAQANGSAVYPMNSTQGLLVNLATDSTGSSLSGWGWQNSAYWLSQTATVTFPTSGTHTLRVQIREDGVALDQIVLSPTTYLNSPPGPVNNDNTIVPKS